MKVDKDVILGDYEKLKRLAQKGDERNDLDFSALCIKKAATLMYESNLIYADSDLEAALGLLSEKVLPQKVDFEKSGRKKKRIAFYDYFALDNRGLTEQYLAALFDSGYELLFVGCNEGEKSKEIYRKLHENSVHVIVVPPKKELERAAFVAKEIEAFCPDIILGHTSPWDVAGLVAIRHFEGACKRYLINITDHAFWLGTKSFDFFIEFRSYGFNISKKHRGISEDNLLMLPYYPLVNENVPFQGFDFDTAGKKLIFSGGSVYKIQGSPAFLNIVRHILKNHEDAIFLYLGNGDLSYFKKFIDENRFQNRFFCRPERKDVYEVFKRCYMYLNTYPLVGGLMTQYACVVGKIPITLNANGKFDANNVDELLLGKSGVQIQYDTELSCEKAVDFYLNDEKALKEAGEKVRSEVISPAVFARHLLSFLDGKTTGPVQPRSYDIDIDLFARQYIQRFNENVLANYCSRFVCLDMRMAFAFWKYFVKVCFFRCLRKAKKILSIAKTL